jgi:activator of HSP90 ATPase
MTCLFSPDFINLGFQIHNKMKTGSIEQTVVFDAEPQAVYEMLMDAHKHAAFTGSEVEMSNEIGGKFVAFGGYVHGSNLELQPGKRIVQKWHFDEDGWPEDHYSTCVFEFEVEGDKTKLHFTQTDIPVHKIEALTSGWYEYYWEPIKADLVH